MKKSFKFYFSMLASKIIMELLRLLKRNATYFPGKVAIRLCPDFLGQIDKPECIIAVTGTNGKTTVCNLIIDILKDNGIDVLDNRAGSNIDAGLASSFIKGSALSGKSRFKTAVLEIDERSSRRIFPYVKPTYLVCTNLFRDSIHRNAHAEYIFDLINDNLPDSTKLILNADDPISSMLKKQNSRTYFAIEPMESDLKECVNIINDMSICPECHTKLKYEYLRYHHIGKVSCPNCGFKSPQPDYSAGVNLLSDSVSVSVNGHREEYKLISKSIFNIYNELSAIVLLREYGLTYEQISKSINNLNIVESRYSSDTVNGIEVITHMAKGQNPVACSCVFTYVSQQSGNKEIILMLDDLFDRNGSSENMTWIFDADFEFLNSESITHIIISGVRCEDYKLRLLIAGVDENKISCVKSELETPKLLALKGTEKVYILHELYAADTAMKVKQGVIDEINRRGGSFDEN